MATTPEFGLLLDAIVPLSRPRVDHRRWNEIQWSTALQLADWHRLSPILFSHLEGAGDAPSPIRAVLERAYLSSAARSLFIATARRQVLEALHRGGVPALPLKGAALVETVYDDPAHREMLDLDILVPRDRLSEAGALLAPLGYRAPPTADVPPRASVPLELFDHHGPPLVGETELLAVELHHHIAIAGEGAAFDIGDLWSRARASAEGTHLLPSHEDLLLHVCLHFTRNRVGGGGHHRHTGGALGQICDIARIAADGAVDWDRMVTAARSYRLETRVFLGLFAARQFGVPIPDLPLTALRPHGFDDRLGRRFLSLRVMRTGDHMPARTLRWMFAPSREVLARGWNADSTAPLSLTRAYIRRARAHAPLARSTLRRPWQFVQDRRLNGEILALQDRS